LFNSCLYAQKQKDGLTWYEDANQAFEQSAKTKKPIFGFFTGSDWCGWCHKLEHDVLSKPEFKTWAAKNVILLELDFPRNKQLPETLANQNAGLQRAFQVQGFPTIWLFFMDKDAATANYKINALGSLGYPHAEPGKEAAAFLETANGILAKKDVKAEAAKEPEQAAKKETTKKESKKTAKKAAKK
jgi:thiol-disulfide isomerase/thioredoxin